LFGNNLKCPLRNVLHFFVLSQCPSVLYIRRHCKRTKKWRTFLYKFICSILYCCYRVHFLLLHYSYTFFSIFELGLLNLDLHRLLHHRNIYFLVSPSVKLRETGETNARTTILSYITRYYLSELCLFFM
jgi:hypothetical protein